jgi:hypothetical protein
MRTRCTAHGNQLTQTTDDRRQTTHFKSFLLPDMIPKPNYPCESAGSLHIASYKDGGRTMQIPLVSKFLCYLEAAARREFVGISLPHQNSSLHQF